MLNILIADDETIILNGMKYAIDNHSDLEMHVIATAKDGFDAYDKAISLHPEIIITDINMPKCDGLDFISNLKKVENYYPEIIILTGYDEFEYAKTAIDLGISSFILKPVNMEDLINALEKAAKRYLENQNIQSLLSNYHSNLAHRMNFFLIDLFLGKINQNADIEKGFAEYQIKQQKFFYIINIKTNLSDELLLSYYDCTQNFYFCIMNSSERCILVFEDAPDIIAISENLTKFYNNIEKYTSTEIKIGVSNFYSENTCFSTAYYESLESAEQSKEPVSFYFQKQNRYSNEVQYAINIIERDYQNNIFINDIAKNLHISTSYLMHKFKQETGASFVNYLTQFRMNKAMELLKKGNLKIYEIAHNVGYSDTKYFNKLFKKATGKSPSDYLLKKE